MPVELEKTGGIGIIHLERPERANALDSSMLRHLAQIQRQLRRDKHIHVVITVGEGKGFCAGSDLLELAGLSRKRAAETQSMEASVCRNFLTLRQPTVAAVHGYAMGGGLFLAAYHDFRVISATARLACPEVKLGWNPTFGMQRLVDVLGVTPSVRLLMSGDELCASDPLLLPFASQVVAEDGEVASVARVLGEKLAGLPAEGLAAIKRALWREGGRKLKETDSDEGRLFRQCLSAAPARSNLARYRKPIRATARKRG